MAKKVRIPISGIGGIGYWNDAAEHIALGASTVQVCTAAMHYGFRIVEDMIDGLSQYMDDHGFRHDRGFPRPRRAECAGLGRSRLELQDHRRNPFRSVHRLPALLRRLRGRRAPVHRALHSDTDGRKMRTAWACTCRESSKRNAWAAILCALVCPVENCITMKEIDAGRAPMSWNDRTRARYMARRTATAAHRRSSD